MFKHYVWIFFVILLVGVLGVTGVVYFNRKSTVGQWECEHNDKEWCNFLAVVNERDPYLLPYAPGRGVDTDASGQSITTTIITDGVNADINVQGVDQQRNMRIVGDMIYVKSSNEPKWRSRKLTTSQKQGLVDVNEIVPLRDLLDVPQPKFLGQEKCGQLTCLVYEGEVEEVGTNNRPDDSIPTGKTLIYFDTREYPL